MDRTVPSRGSDDLSLYTRTYYSLLRSSSEVKIKTLVDTHKRMRSALHVGADQPEPDLAAFIYVTLRLPSPIDQVRLVIMGQSEKVFEEHGYPVVESWQPVGAPGRRRYSFWDRGETVAVYIASRSDIDDLVPSLTAYQIERRKLYRILNKPEVIEWLEASEHRAVTDSDLQELSFLSALPFDDLDRLRRIWRGCLCERLLTIATRKQSLSVRLLSGSLADYRRATRRWWLNVDRAVSDITFEDRPIYFISSNTHSMSNLLSGFALLQETELVEFIGLAGNEELQTEYRDILERNVPSSRENFLYYAMKKYEQVRPDVRAERLEHERQIGMTRVPSQHVFDIEVQVVEMERLSPEDLDPRLRLPGLERIIGRSSALIVNIDFPLGMAAYQVLSEISRNTANIRGVYIMGKAATLNGRIGDVMLPNVVHDEHSLNTYLFTNCFSAGDIAPNLVYGSVLDNQKGVSAMGTFLQNEVYMDVFYQEGYTIIEMEAGPYLSSIYELIRPQRYPYNEVVNLQNLPFPFGIIHYASDTPFSKGRNLGSQNLSYFGMDPTYASMTAILSGIFREEIAHCLAENSPRNQLSPVHHKGAT
jgi:hypothetical protein